MKRLKVGLLSDSPDCPSGLGRITRDLATRLYKSSLPIEVATLGFNGQGSREFGWQQYSLGLFSNASDIPKLMPAWMDFTRGEGGLLFCIYDIPRLEAFRFPLAYGRPWAEFLGQDKSPFTLVGYFPIDGHTPKGMTQQMAETLRAFDSVGGYGPYGRGILDSALATLGDGPKPTHIWSAPHGIDTAVFRPMGKEAGRARLTRTVASELKDENGNPLPRTINASSEDRLLGVVATNQIRKDWGAAFQIFRRLDGEWKFWLHTDRLLNSWSIPDLVEQCGLDERVFITGGLDDASLAELYSACDVTLGIGSGEGFGYPLVESLSCGVPVLHTNYAGGADLLPQDLLVDPLSLSPSGPYCTFRPALDVEEWGRKIRLGEFGDVNLREWAASRYDWGSLWKREWLPIWEHLVKMAEGSLGHGQARTAGEQPLRGIIEGHRWKAER